MGTGSSGCGGLHSGFGYHGLARKRTGSGDCRHLGRNSTAARAPLVTSKSTTLMAAPDLCFHSLGWIMPVSTCKINQFSLQMSLRSLPTPTARVHAGLRAQCGSCNVGDAALHRNPWNGILSSSGFCSSLQAKSNINNIQSTFPYVDIFIKPHSLSLLFFSTSLVSCTYTYWAK